jgi:hypothetical protein
MTLPGNWVAMAVLCGMAAAAPTGRGSSHPVGPRSLRSDSPPGDEDPA